MNLRTKQIIWNDNTEPPHNYLWVKDNKILQYDPLKHWIESPLISFPDNNCQPEEKSLDPNGYEYIDLDLPSGTLWATKNLGAENWYDYGDNYGFADPNIFTGTENMPYRSDNYRRTKYYNQDWLDTVEYKDDAARQRWGGDWKTPSKYLYEELIEFTTQQVEEISNDTGTDGVIKGIRFTSKNNGKSIFFPAGGYNTNSSSHEIGGNNYKDVWGMYWTSTSNIYDDKSYAYRFYFDTTENLPVAVSLGNHFRGMLIRPVICKRQDVYYNILNINGTWFLDRNLGAKSLFDSGNYYAWGEIAPKNNFTWLNYKWNHNNTITKYNTEDSKVRLDPQDMDFGIWLPKPEQDGYWSVVSTESIDYLDSNLGYCNYENLVLPYSGYKDGDSIQDCLKPYCWTCEKQIQPFMEDTEAWSYTYDLENQEVGTIKMNRNLGMPIRLMWFN